MNNLYCFKLSNGEEVIGRCDLPDNWYEEKIITIENAISFVPTQQGLGAAPWPNAGNNKKITMNTQHCMTIAVAHNEIEPMYIKATTNIDIAAPSQSGIIM